MGRPLMPPAAFFSSTASVTPFFIQSPRTAFVPLIAPMMAILIGSPVALAAVVGCAAAAVGCAGAAVGCGAAVGAAQAASNTPNTIRTNRIVRFIANLLLVFDRLREFGTRRVPRSRTGRAAWSHHPLSVKANHEPLR